MPMKYLISISLMVSFLVSCKPQKGINESEIIGKEKEAFVHFFKIQTYCSCIKYGYSNKDINTLMAEEDLLGSYDDLADPFIQGMIDSLGKQVSIKIQPEEYLDFQNKRRITETCLGFYTSSELDSIAHTTYKKVKRR